MQLNKWNCWKLRKIPLNSFFFCSCSNWKMISKNGYFQQKKRKKKFSVQTMELNEELSKHFEFNFFSKKGRGVCFQLFPPSYTRHLYSSRNLRIFLTRWICNSLFAPEMWVKETLLHNEIFYSRMCSFSAHFVFWMRCRWTHTYEIEWSENNYFPKKKRHQGIKTLVEHFLMNRLFNLKTPVGQGIFFYKSSLSAVNEEIVRIKTFFSPENERLFQR